MIFTNGELIFPDRIADGLSLRVSDGKIKQIASEIESGGDEIIDLARNYLAPGLIDLHVHGGMGRDTMEGTLEAFRAICAYHAGGGTTSLLLTTVTAPVNEIVRVVDAIEGACDEIPQLRGAHVEGPFISPEKAGAQRKEFIVEAKPELVAQLLQRPGAIKRVTLAPEVAGACGLISRLTTLGIASSGGHSAAWDEEVQAGFERGLRQVTHTFNCMSSARRRGSERVAGLLEFALSEPEIFCELIADGRHVSPTLAKMLYRAKGAGGICLVTDSIAGAGLPNESHFSLFGNDCVVRDGACWLADGSALAGSSSRMIDLVKWLVLELRLPLHEVVRMATETPALAMGWKSKGVLAEGMDADLVVLSSELKVLQAYSAGECLFRA